jgi:hypothetical protein
MLRKIWNVRCSFHTAENKKGHKCLIGFLLCAKWVWLLLKMLNYRDMTLHLLTLLYLCMNLCHSTLSLLMRFSAMWLVSSRKTQDVLTGRKITILSQSKVTILAKLRDALAKFQKQCFMKCLEWWRDQWTHCTKSQRDGFAKRTTLIRSICYHYEEIKWVKKLFYCIMHTPNKCIHLLHPFICWNITSSHHIPENDGMFIYKPRLSETAVSLIAKNVLKLLPQHKGVEVRYCDGLQVHWCLLCLQCLELVP